MFVTYNGGTNPEAVLIPKNYGETIIDSVLWSI